MHEDWETAPAFGFNPQQGDTIVRPSAYVLIERLPGHIAVVRAPQGIYLPGGGIERFESPEDAAVRECVEEAGLMVQVGAWRRAAIEYVYGSRAGYEKRSTFLDATVIGSLPAPVESDHELLWLETSKALGALTPGSHRWAVEQWFARGSV